MAKLINLYGKLKYSEFENQFSDTLFYLRSIFEV